MTTAVSITVYKTRARKTPYTWRMNSANGKIIANAAETFDTAGNARRAAKRLGSLIGCQVSAVDPDGQTRVIQVAAEEPKHDDAVSALRIIQPNATNQADASRDGDGSTPRV